MDQERTFATRALTRRAAVTGLGALGLALTSRRLKVSAQDATPAPVAAVGVTAQLLGGGRPAVKAERGALQASPASPQDAEPRVSEAPATAPDAFPIEAHQERTAPFWRSWWQVWKQRHP